MEEDEFEITVGMQDEVYVVTVESGAVCDVQDDREVGRWDAKQRRIVFHPAGPAAAATTAHQGTIMNPMNDSKPVEAAPKLVRNPMEFDDTLDVEQPREAQQKPQRKSTPRPKVEPVARPTPQPVPVRAPVPMAPVSRPAPVRSSAGGSQAGSSEPAGKTSLGGGRFSKSSKAGGGADSPTTRPETTAPPRPTGTTATEQGGRVYNPMDLADGNDIDDLLDGLDSAQPVPEQTSRPPAPVQRAAVVPRPAPVPVQSSKPGSQAASQKSSKTGGRFSKKGSKGSGGAAAVASPPKPQAPARPPAPPRPPGD